MENTEENKYLKIKKKTTVHIHVCIDLELPYTPPPSPPRGILQGYIFLKAYTKCYKMSHVSTLAVGAFRIFGVQREEIMQKSLKIGNNF